MPKISVILPVYNVKEEYLRESIESVLNQTFSDFEFIIIDDNSTNNAEEVILSYKDSRIIYVKNETNIGLTATLNNGFKLAKGDYIARMDSDDISLPQRFEKQLLFMDAHLDIGVLGTFVEMIPQRKIVIRPTEHDEIVKCLLFMYCALFHPTIFIRASEIEKFNIVYNSKNDKCAEDYELWLSLINKVKFANLPEILLSYRQHNESITSLSDNVLACNDIKLKTEAQSKFLRLDLSNELEISKKIINKKRLNTHEIDIYIKYLELILVNLNDSMPDYYQYFEFLYKRALLLSSCRLKFFKILLASPINKTLKISSSFKYKTILYYMKNKVI